MNLSYFSPQGMRRQGKRSPSPSNRLNQPSQSPDLMQPRPGDVASAVGVATVDSLLSAVARQHLLQYLQLQTSQQQSQLPINNTLNVLPVMQQPSNAMSSLRQSLADNPMYWFVAAPIPAARATAARSEFDQPQEPPRQVQNTYLLTYSTAICNTHLRSVLST